MDKAEIEKLLKTVLGVKKDVIALKALKAIPSDIPHYEGVAAPGLCTQIGEVLQEGKTFYVTRENNVCYEGLIATGVCDISRKEYREAVETFIDMCPYHKDVDTAMSFHENLPEDERRVFRQPEDIKDILLHVLGDDSDSTGEIFSAETMDTWYREIAAEQAE